LIEVEDIGPTSLNVAFDAQSRYDDIALALSAGVNLLLVGDPAETSRVLRLAALNLTSPVTAWRPGDSLDRAVATSTLVVRDVGALEPADQARLLRWLARPVSPRVISTVHTCLWPRVTTGGFDRELYYRLNTVRVDVASRAGRH
jgi:hypothetical protein